MGEIIADMEGMSMWASWYQKIVIKTNHKHGLLGRKYAWFVGQ